jgi:putative transposase
MSHPYTELYYHFVWATREREPLVSKVLETHLFRFLRHKCQTLGVMVHALNGSTDHVHLVATVPAKLALAEFMHDLKGASSHFVNEDLPELGIRLYWQKGYGVLTFAKRELPWVVSYVDGQKTRHRNNLLSPKLERTLED